MDNGDRSGAGAGAVGSAGSLGLRVGQAVFSSASLLFMSVVVEFFSYTAFWYVCFSASVPSFLVFALLPFRPRFSLKILHPITSNVWSIKYRLKNN